MTPAERENPRFLVRTAKASDIPTLQLLIERSVRQLQINDYSQAQIDGAVGFAFSVDTQLIEDQSYFVAEPRTQPGHIVACGRWSNRKTLYGGDHAPDRDLGFLDPATDAVKIRAIFVDPDWARQGLGTLILQHCEDAARQAGFHKAEMGSTRTGVPLYLLKGYVTKASFGILLPNGESLPIIHMVKQL